MKNAVYFLVLFEQLDLEKQKNFLRNIFAFRFVSEYNMPSDFKCIWQKEMMCTLDSNRKENDKKNIRIEKLFRYKM